MRPSTVYGEEVMRKTLREIAELINGEVHGDPNTEVSGVADIPDAVDGDVVFAESPKHYTAALECAASAIIATRGVTDTIKPLITVDKPRLAFARILEAFAPDTYRAPGIDPSSTVDASARIGSNPSISHHVHIGRDVTIGNDVWIYPYVYIGDGAHIGDGSVIHPFVSIYDHISLGNRVVIHSGTVLGSDGFGYTRVDDKHYKIPQIGTIEIGDDVEVGSNVTIDRARTGKTTIGKGTKVDNLVHIAHNVTIGENCIVIAQVGISGSVKIGDRAMLTGQAGVKDHVTIGEDAIICGRGGVIGDIAPGEFVSGYPARPHKEQLKTYAVQQKLPGLMRLVKDLERRIKELEEHPK